MDEKFEDKFDVKIVTTEEQRKNLTHLTSYAFLSAPVDLSRPQQGFESVKQYPLAAEIPCRWQVSPAAN